MNGIVLSSDFPWNRGSSGDGGVEAKQSNSDCDVKIYSVDKKNKDFLVSKEDSTMKFYFKMQSSILSKSCRYQKSTKLSYCGIW